MFILTLTLISFCYSEIPPRLSPKEISEFYSSLKSQSLKAVDYQSKGYGLQVQKPISERGVAICVPKSLKLTANSTYPLSSYVSSLPELTQLKIKVLYYKFLGDPQDFYTKYIRSLSNHFFHIGQWSGSHKSYFESVTLESLPEDDLYGLDELKSITLALENAGIPEEMLEYESYMWASYSVSSRFFSYWENDMQFPVLIPFVDLPNHYPNPKKFRDSELFLSGSREDCLPTYWKLEPGDEFRIDYSDHKALFLLLDYGMVFENNPRDYFEVEVEGDLPEWFEENLLYLYAEDINIDLLRILAFKINKDVEITNIRKDWKKLSLEDRKTVFQGLMEYRKNILNLMENWEKGLREVRRTLKKQRDFIYEMINKYAVAVRETYYRHFEMLSREILFVLLKGNAED